MPRRRRKLKVEEGKLGRQLAVGICYQNENHIILDPRQNAKMFMDTAIHEGLHHAQWNMSETAVIKTARIIRNILWELGYRRVVMK